MATPVRFQAPDRAAWTRWLEDNHASAVEIHLVFYRKGAGRPTIFYDEAVEEALCFGWIDGVKHKIDDERYTYRFTPRRPGSRWSDVNKARIADLELAGKLRPAGIAAIELARSSGVWEQPARTPMPEAMPMELAARLAASAKARAAYAAQPPGMQRLWQRWIHEAKRAETRVRRAARAVELLVAKGSHPWTAARKIDPTAEPVSKPKAIARPARRTTAAPATKPARKTTDAAARAARKPATRRRR